MSMEYSDIQVIGKSENYNKTVTSPSVNIFQNASIVKPNQVSQLAYHDLNSSQVLLTWTLPEGLPVMLLEALNYQIKLQSQNDWDVRTLHYNPGRAKVQEIYHLSGLVPFTWYTLRIRCKPTAAKNSSLYWSNWASVTFTTEQDVPSLPPTLSPGSYSISKCGAEECLILYWKNPDPRYRNGPLTGYLINIQQTSSVDNDNFTVSKTSNSSVTLPDTYTVMVIDTTTEWIEGQRVSALIQEPLPRNEAYDVQVSVATKVGHSRLASRIFIPAIEKGQKIRAKWVSTEVDLANKRVLVSWAADQYICGSITEVTYFFCTLQLTMNVSFIECQDDLDWATYPVDDGCKNDTWKWISVNGENVADLRYAMAIVANGTSGEMVWQNFRFTNHAAVPEQPLFSAEPGPSKQDSVTVTLFYDEGHVSYGGRPQYFLVSCSKEEQQQCQKGGWIGRWKVDFSNPAITIQDLEAGSTYSVCVMAENEAGNSSLGKPKLVSLHKVGESNTGLIVGLSFTGAVILIGTIVVLIVRFKRYLKELKKRNFIPTLGLDLVMSQDVEDKQEDVLEKFESDDEKSSSNDSGRGTFTGSSENTPPLQKDSTGGTNTPGSVAYRKNSITSLDRWRRSPSPAMSGYVKVCDGSIDSTEDSVGNIGAESSGIEEDAGTHAETVTGDNTKACVKFLQDVTENPAFRGNDGKVFIHTSDQTLTCSNNWNVKEKACGSGIHEPHKSTSEISNIVHQEEQESNREQVAVKMLQDEVGVQYVQHTDLTREGILRCIQKEPAENAEIEEAVEVREDDVNIIVPDAVDLSSSNGFTRDYTTSTWVSDYSVENVNTDVSLLHFNNGEELIPESDDDDEEEELQDSIQSECSIGTDEEDGYVDDIDQHITGYSNTADIAFESSSEDGDTNHLTDENVETGGEENHTEKNYNELGHPFQTSNTVNDDLEKSSHDIIENDGVSQLDLVKTNSLTENDKIILPHTNSQCSGKMNEMFSYVEAHMSPTESPDFIGERL